MAAWADSLRRFLTWGGGEQRSGTEWFSTGADSVHTVNAETATYLGPVFASIRHLVDYAATLPVDFYRSNPDGSTVEVSPPELVRNVADEFGWSTWLGQAMYGLLTRGNAVGLVTQVSGYSLPTMIEWHGDWSGGDSSSFYIGGRARSDALVAHVPWIVPPGKRLGLAPIDHYAAMVRAGLSAQEYADVSRGGGIPPAHLKNNAKRLDPEEAAGVQSRAIRSFASGKPFVTGNDWDLNITTIPPNQAQFIETMKLTATQIAAIYGIDPREIGGSASDSLTYSNDESRALNRGQNAAPYLARLEEAVSGWLPEKVRMRLNWSAKIRADIKTRTEVIGAQIQDGRLSVNEARALEDRPPVPGGDYHNVPAPKADPTSRNGADNG